MTGEKRKNYKREYHHKTKVARNISRRMRQSLNGFAKSNNWENLVNFTLQDLKLHLEKMFYGEMSWSNYGSHWHIDHIRPISSFNITSDSCDDFRKCWTLENLQPLLAIDNLTKSNKFKVETGA